MNDTNQLVPAVYARPREYFDIALTEDDVPVMKLAAFALLKFKRPPEVRDMRGVFDAIHHARQLSDGWRALFEDAYQRLPGDRRKYARPIMAELYWSLGECELTAQFLPAKPYWGHEIVFAMRVYLRLGRFKAAAAVADVARESLANPQRGQSEAAAREALENYHVALGQWEEASALREEAKLGDSENPFQRAVRLHALRAWLKAKEGLKAIAAYRLLLERQPEKAAYSTFNVQEAERELTEWERGLGVIARSQDYFGAEPRQDRLPIASVPFDGRTAINTLLESIEHELEGRIEGPKKEQES